jgi:hypothetical protein
MNQFVIWLATEAPSDVVIDDTWYSPGVVGFIATFGMAAAALLLIADLVRRIRRVRYRAEISQLLDQEQTDQANSQTFSTSTKPDRPAPPEKPQR